MVPKTAVIARHNPESERSRRQTGVECLSPVAGRLPVAIAAFELVAETDLSKHQVSVGALSNGVDAALERTVSGSSPR